MIGRKYQHTLNCKVFQNRGSILPLIVTIVYNSDPLLWVGSAVWELKPQSIRL